MIDEDPRPDSALFNVLSPLVLPLLRSVLLLLLLSLDQRVLVVC